MLFIVRKKKNFSFFLFSSGNKVKAYFGQIRAFSLWITCVAKKIDFYCGMFSAALGASVAPGALVISLDTSFFGVAK